MQLKFASCDHPHPELSRLQSGEISLDGPSIVPCAPNCALQLAAELWPAWRLLPLWQKRVDAELPGDFTLLLPSLALMPGTGLGDVEPTSAPIPEAEPAGDVVQDHPSDELPEVIVDALREAMYRSIFALGAAWAQTRRDHA